MRLSVVSTPAEVERFWERRSVAVEGHKTAQLDAAKGNRRDGVGGRRLRVSPSGSVRN